MVTGREADRSAPGLPFGWLDRLRLAVRVDLAPARSGPPARRAVVAAIAAVVLSLGFDEAAVHVSTALYPTTAHFVHFRFFDYGTLTVLGVLIACVAWPVITKVTSSPRWLFIRLAVVTTLLLWIPDGWLLQKGENAKGVATLMIMHLGIALVTYNVLVRGASVGPSVVTVHEGPGGTLSEVAVRRIWSSMALVVALELVLGVVSILAVPFRRPDAVLPPRGVWVYGAHGVVGVILGVGAVAVLVLASLGNRMARFGAVMGAVGTAVGLGGGVLATIQSTRLLAMGVMMIGVVVAGIGYLLPSLEAMGKAEAARAEAAREALARAQAERSGATRTNGKGA